MARIEREERYVINGVEYTSLDDIPAEHRAVIENLLKGAADGETKIDAATSSTVSQVFLNGKEVTGELGGMTGAIIGKMLEDKDGDGVPDLLERRLERRLHRGTRPPKRRTGLVSLPRRQFRTPRACPPQPG